MDDERKSGFCAISQYCQQHGKDTLTHYVAYCEYKKTFSDIVITESQKNSGKLSSKQFQQLKDSQLHDAHIERYVKQAEEMLTETSKNVQKAILDSHQQELKKIVQKNNWWREFWFAVGTNIAANLIYWGLAFIFFLVFKEQVVSLLNDFVK